MKIKEITEAYSETPMNVYFQAKGYTRIGYGLDKSVYEWPNNSDKILVVIDRGHYAARETFLKWIEFCKGHSSIEYLPKYYTIKNIVFGGKPYTFVLMEKLYKNTKLGETLIASMVDNIEYGISFNEWINDLSGETRIGEHRQIDSILNDKMQVSQLKEFYNLILKLAKLASSNRYTLDLHPGNIMMRKDTTPVIIDPIVD